MGEEKTIKFIIEACLFLLVFLSADVCNGNNAFERIMRVNSQAALKSDRRRGGAIRGGGGGGRGDLSLTDDNGHRVELFEGDIVFTADVEANIRHDPNAIRSRDAATGRDWPRGVVPYTIRRGDEGSIGGVVRQAADTFHSTFPGCIEWKYFQPHRKREHPRHIEFYVGRGCFSYIGMIRRRSQKISLGYGCWSKGIALHEMMHALGFYHEHSRIDRDAYVQVLWDNIEQGRRGQFKKYYLGAAETLGEPYDIHSIMHYPSRAFSRNGYPTILTRNGGYIAGQRYGLSDIDVKQLKKYYKCDRRTNTRTNNRGGGRRGGGRGTNVRGRCRDVKSYCLVWAGGGYCDDYRFLRYMRKNCKKTCGRC